jgi:hypothetical protein
MLQFCMNTMGRGECDARGSAPTTKGGGNRRGVCHLRKESVHITRGRRRSMARGTACPCPCQSVEHELTHSNSSLTHIHSRTFAPLPNGCRCFTRTDAYSRGAQEAYGCVQVCDVCLTMVPGPSAILLQRLAAALKRRPAVNFLRSIDESTVIMSLRRACEHTDVA